MLQSNLCVVLQLLAVHSESQSHARNVTSLQSELEQERLSHQEAILSLSTGTCITHNLRLSMECEMI